jgi:peptide/nickel transport system permease protein
MPFVFALKRLAAGLLMYLLLMLVFSAIFNTTNEATARAQIEEQVRMEATRLRSASAEQVEIYIREQRERKYTAWRLDRPLIERILFRAWETVSLRLGNSTIIRSSAGEREVFAIIAEVMPRTILLFGSAILLELVLGILLGLGMARRPGGLLDRITSLGTMAVYGMPAWWFGMLMIMLFAYILPVFPSGGWSSTPPPQGLAAVPDVLAHMALPLGALVVIRFWGTAFLTRNIVVDVLQQDYISAARARGLPEKRVLFVHSLRSAAPPLATTVVLSLLASVSGNIVYEGIFSWPGMGNLYWIAVEQNDIPVLMGLLSLTTGLYIAGLVALDILYGFLDPRIRTGGRS